MQRISAALSAIVFSMLLVGPISAATAKEPVTCADGTSAQHGGKGACSGHGGIKKSGVSGEKKSKANKDTKKSKKEAKSNGAPAATSTAPARSPVTTATKSSASKSTSKSTPANSDPNGASARCKDNTYSHAKTHRGACARHGGVAEWLDGSGKK